MSKKRTFAIFGAVALIATVLFSCMWFRAGSPPADIRDANYIATRADLSRLLGNVDFTDLEIVDIRVIGNTIYVFCEGPDDAMQFDIEDDFLTTHFFENVLSRVYLTEDAVLEYAIAVGLYRNRQIDSIREIYWFQLDRNYSDSGNILLVTDLPHSFVQVNTRAIMNDQD